MEYREVIYTSQYYFLLQQNAHQLSYGWIVYQQCGLCFPGSFTNNKQWFSLCKSTSPVIQLDSWVIANILTELLCFPILAWKTRMLQNHNIHWTHAAANSHVQTLSTLFKIYTMLPPICANIFCDFLVMDNLDTCMSTAQKTFCTAFSCMGYHVAPSCTILTVETQNES